MKSTKPTRVVIDFNVYPKLGEALKAHVKNINDDQYAPKYSSVTQFIIELIGRELKSALKSAAVPAKKDETFVDFK